MAMRLSRRSFLKGAAASAALASTHVLGLASRAAAAEAGGRILVLVNLAGGNDFLNTVIPRDDAGAPQRSVYEALRPDLAVPLSELGGLSVGSAPGLGTGLGLHPSLAELHRLYGQGRLAIVLGTGLAGGSLSHAEAEKAWFFGRSNVVADPRGWVGRQLDASGATRARAVSFGGEVSPSLQGARAEALGVVSVDSFALPDDPLWHWRDGLERGAALRALLADGRSGLAETVARSGRLLLDEADLLDAVETRGWGSALEEETWGLGRDLRDVASLLRHDLRNPGAGADFRFYHVRVAGYDTHTRQGATDPTWGQPKLLAQLARCLVGFQRDLDALGLASRVVTLVYSEFGRRVAQTANIRQAGTDHGAAGGMLLVGDPVAGGLHGAMPRLDELDGNGNLRVTTDFRRVYASLIDDWLGGDHTAVLGAPFEKLALIQA